MERLKKIVGNLITDRGDISGTSTAIDCLTSVVISIFIHVRMRHCAGLQVETSILEEYAATFHGYDGAWAASDVTPPNCKVTIEVCCR
jgi:hypothetical protein